MIKQLKVYEGSAVHFGYGVVGEDQGSWNLLDPIELDNGKTLQVVHEVDYLVEDFELDEEASNYVFYRYPVYGDNIIGIEHFERAVKYCAGMELRIPLIKLARVQLDYSLYEANQFAIEQKENDCATARAHYLKAKTK